jgi:hypothetical protein
LSTLGLKIQVFTYDRYFNEVPFSDGLLPLQEMFLFTNSKSCFNKQPQTVVLQEKKENPHNQDYIEEFGVKI